MNRFVVLIIGLLGFLGNAAPVLAASRYAVSYASGENESGPLMLVTEATVQPEDVASDALRAAFAERLKKRDSVVLEKFVIGVRVFSSQEEAETFRLELIERAQVIGTVEPVALTATEQAALLPDDTAQKFEAWPFDRKEAKRRQLLASEIWNMPVEIKVAGREFVLIPPGEFMMGSPVGETGRSDDEQLHRVKITRPFWMARDDEPMESEGWGDFFWAIFAQAPAGYIFRIPTEAEWEYAARAGTATLHYGGDSPIPAAYGHKLTSLTRGVLAPAGPARQHAPNAWGLYDMLGRLEELVADTYAPYPASAGLRVDPKQENDIHYIIANNDFSSSSGKGFIMRGGHYWDSVEALRAAARRRAGWTFLHYHYIAPGGFRLVMEKAEDTAHPRHVKQKTTLEVLREHQKTLK